MSDTAPLNRGQALAVYSEKLWGIRTKLVPLSAVAVGVSSTKLCNNNPRRFGLILVNQGAGNVYVDFGQAPALNQGILLGPNGGSITLAALEDGELTGYDAYAISPAVGNTVDVWEIQGE